MGIHEFLQGVKKKAKKQNINQRSFGNDPEKKGKR